jgi:Ca-activated chloride channel family protein
MRGGEREFIHEVEFPAREEGAAFLGRLWAIRRVGHLLDEIRLRGETAEVRDEVVRLAKRHGILTPYTSWLVLEDEGGLAGGGGGRRERARGNAPDEFEEALAREALAGGFGGPGGDVPADSRQPEDPPPPGGRGGGTPTPVSAPAPAPGAAAIGGSLEAKKLRDAEQSDDDGGGGDRLRDVLRVLDGRSFRLRDGVWWQADVAADAPRTKVVAFSREYLDLAASDRALAKAFALGRVIVRKGDVVYEVVDAL